MAERHDETSARDGWITFALSLALWLFLLAVFLGVGHELGVSLTEGH